MQRRILYGDDFAKEISEIIEGIPFDKLVGKINIKGTLTTPNHEFFDYLPLYSPTGGDAVHFVERYKPYTTQTINLCSCDTSEVKKTLKNLLPQRYYNSIHHSGYRSVYQSAGCDSFVDIEMEKKELGVMLPPAKTRLLLTIKRYFQIYSDSNYAYPKDTKPVLKDKVAVSCYLK